MLRTWPHINGCIRCAQSAPQYLEISTGRISIYIKLSLHQHRCKPFPLLSTDARLQPCILYSCALTSFIFPIPLAKDPKYPSNASTVPVPSTSLTTHPTYESGRTTTTAFSPSPPLAHSPPSIFACPAAAASGTRWSHTSSA